MTNINFLDFWTFFAGLGFFLFGMNSIERILKNSSGRSFKLFLKRNTKNLFKSILGGTLVTALVQSSSVVSLLVLTFVEARILPFRNAMGVILGANLGTTLTSWIVATVGFKFDLISYCLPVIAISALGQFFSENRKKLNNFFSILFALGVVFLGLSYIKEGADYLVNHFDLRPYLQYGTIVFVLIGFLLTTIIQSSSTTVAITLAAIHSGLLDFPTGAAVVIGSEVGTTMKVLLWGIQGSPDKKRVGWGTFIYNIFTAIIAFFLLDRIIQFITQFLPYHDPLIRLVFFQSFINVLSIVLFLPLLPLLSKWLEGKFKEGEAQQGSYISPNLPNVPLLAVDALKREAQNMLEKVLHYIGKVLDRGQSGTKGRVGSVRSLSAIERELQITYQRIKHTEGDLLEYYTHLPLNQFSKNESGMLLNYIHAVRHCVYSAKAIKDILHNLDEFDNSENDLIHGAGLVIRRDWISFESQFKKLLSKTPDETMETDLVELLVQVRGYERKQKARLLEMLKADQINEMETSTLMNVNREIMSCKKSLIKAFMDIQNQFLSLDDDVELMD